MKRLLVLLVLSVLVRDYHFSPEYEATILKKQIAEEQAKTNQKATLAASEDAKRKLRAAEGEAFQMTATADGAKMMMNRSSVSGSRCLLSIKTICLVSIKRRGRK